MPAAKNAINIIVYAIVGICIAMVAVKFWPNSECDKSKNEGFAGSIESSGLSSCPSGTKSYSDQTGAINCCAGVVNGNTCEGTVKCTFSGSLTSKYPLCGTTRRRKYTGEINPFVVQLFGANPELFQTNLLPFMTNMLTRLKSMIPSQLSEAAYKKYNALVDEEVAWNKELRSDISTKAVTPQEANIYTQEEVMYILNSVIGIFQGQPIASNQSLIQKEFQSQVCKKV